MKNKIILFILLLALIAAPFAYAGPTEEAQLLQLIESYLPGLPVDQQEAATETARIVTNDELSQYYQGDDYYPKTILDGKRLNPLNFAEYEVLAYDDRYGTIDGFGEKRYLGFTAMKEAYTNVFFRPDFVDGVQIDQADWLLNPWENGLVEEFLERLREPVLKKNDFNNRTIYRDNIMSGFEVLNQIYPDYYGFNYAAAKDRDWEKYVQILQPPSKYCWGTGRMFRQLPDKSIRYMDVPLISFGDAALDFSVKLEKDSYQAKPGEVIETTATFELNKEYYKPREAKLRLYLETATELIELPFTSVDPSKKIIDGKYTFKPDEKLEVKLNFSAPNSQAELVGSIDGTFIKGVTWVEKNSDDNEARAPIVLNAYDVKIELTSDKDTLTRLSSGGGDRAAVTALVTRKDNIPGDLPITITLHLGGDPIVIPMTLGPGGSHSIDFPFAGSYTTTLTGEVWPDGKDDANPGDNTSIIIIAVNELSVPQGDSKIIPTLIDSTKYR